MNVDEALEKAFDAYDKHAPWRGQQSADFLASLRANGYEIVPKKPTKQMIEIGQQWFVGDALLNGGGDE